jgi:hypothetical protein
VAKEGIGDEHNGRTSERRLGTDRVAEVDCNDVAEPHAGYPRSALSQALRSAVYRAHSSGRARSAASESAISR